jgi:uncharacterized protein
VTELFRIETDQTRLTWSDRSQSDSTADTQPPEGRLAISPADQRGKTIRIRRHGMPAEAANNLKVEVGPRLYEEKFYDVLLQSKDKRVELKHDDPTIVKSLQHPSEGDIVHGAIDFRGNVGGSNFSVYVDGQHEYDFEVEVFPSKLDYATDYDVLLADLQEIMAGLVLAFLRSTYQLGVVTDSEGSSRIEWLLLLRHVVGNLEDALRHIQRNPYDELAPERVSTRVEKLRRPDAKIARMIVQGKGEGAKSKTSSGRVLPVRLPERRAQATWDIPEHRWLKSQLRLIRRTLAEIHLSERKSRSGNRLRQLRILEEIAKLEDRIEALQRLEFIARAKGSVRAGYTSPRFEAKPGYREAHRACSILLQGLRVDGGPVGLSVKEIPALYEYWCYLTVIKLVAKITGEPIPVRELFAVRQNGLRVRLLRGTSQTVKFATGGRVLEVTYNPEYKGDAFVLPQKPDMVLAIHDPSWPTTRLVIDAKYRIETSPAYVKHYGSPGPPQISIDALHRYRDAILVETGSSGPRSATFKHSVIECVALFPHADVDDQFRSGHFWTQLKRVGIGAIPLLPRETRYLEEWLRRVLAQGGSDAAEQTIPYESLEQLRLWQQAEKETVLVAVLKLNAKEHLDWIKTQRCYYTTFTPSQGRQLFSRWIGIYSPTSMRRPGAVTHLAAVEDFAIKKRHQIDTPWSPRRGSEMQIVYKLGEVRELENPIENRGPSGLGRRFSNNRWTSRLGILRASELRELFLETSAEWRLYEQLRIAEVEFTLKPGAARPHNEFDPQGRTWFIGKDLRVLYRGAAGYLIRRTGVRDEYRSDLQDVVERFISAPS